MEVDYSNDLNTLSTETLQAPESRIKNVRSVRNRIWEIRQGDLERQIRRTKLQGLIDGNQPYNKDKMAAAGRADDANINFREAEGMIAAATTPYYDLVFEVPKAVNIELYYGENKQKNVEWANIIAEKYTKTLWNWKGYDIQTQLSQWQMVVHGQGLIMWSSPRGWYFEARKAGTFLVADNAPCDLDKLEEGINQTYFTPTQLFRLIDRKNIIKGWNVKKAKWAIINAIPQDDKDTLSLGNSWEAYQVSLRRGDVQWSNKALRIYYTDYFVKEFDSKITHCIVLDRNPNQNENPSNVDDGEDDFLFKQVGRFESFHDIINPFFYDVGPDGAWYSVKGLGPKIFDFCDLSNRFRCTIINGALATCGPIIQAANAQALQKLQQTPIVRSSGVTMVPPDWNKFDVNVRGQLDGPMAVQRELQNTLQSNTGQYRQRVSEENQEPTLGQAQLNAAAQSTLSKGAYNRHYHYDDLKHEQIIKRMLDPKISENDGGGKEAKDFIDECVRCGVPKEALQFKNFISIRAVRNMGYGSPQMQQIVSGKLAEMLPQMDQVSRNHAQRTIIAPFVGQTEVESFFPDIEKSGVANDQQAFAVLENNALRQIGGEVLVTPYQNPAIHFTEHFKDCIAHVKQLQAGQAQPIEVLIHLEQAGPHMGDHLQAMEGDPTQKDQYEQFKKMWLALAKMTDQLKKQVAQAQAQQQTAQGQPDPKAVTELMKTVADIHIKDKLADAKIQRDEKKFNSTQRLKDLAAADKMYRNAAEKGAPVQNGVEAPVGAI